MLFAPRYPKSPPLEMRREAPGARSDRGPEYRLCFSHGRTALKYGLMQLDLREGDRILVPDFVCDAAVLPLAALRIEPVWYPVDSSLAPDWDALDRAARSGARGLMMIHYFGRPQHVETYRDICRARGLFLIEDNAHGYGGRHGGVLLGTLGDIGISSPWKNFPVRNGGLLHVAGGSVRDGAALPQEPGRLFPTKRRLLGLCAAGWRSQNRRFSHELQAIPATAPIPDWGMRSDAIAFLRQQDLAVGAARRRTLFKLWHDWALAAGLQPVFDGPAPEDAPLVYPAYCRSAEERRRWLEWLWRHGVEAYSWPKLPAEVLKAGGTAKDLWERILCLPVHQYMSPAGLAEDLVGWGYPNRLG